MAVSGRFLVAMNGGFSRSDFFKAEKSWYRDGKFYLKVRVPYGAGLEKVDGPEGRFFLLTVARRCGIDTSKPHFIHTDDYSLARIVSQEVRFLKSSKVDFDPDEAFPMAGP